MGRFGTAVLAGASRPRLQGGEGALETRAPALERLEVRAVGRRIGARAPRAAQALRSVGVPARGMRRRHTLGVRLRAFDDRLDVLLPRLALGVLGRPLVDEAAHVLGRVRRAGERGHPLVHRGVARGVEGRPARLARLAAHPAPVLAQALVAPAQRARRRAAAAGHRPERLVGGAPFAALLLQRLDEPLAVIGEHRHRLACPADLHIEGQLVGERHRVGLEHRDDPLAGRALRGVRGRRVGVVHVAQLPVLARERERSPVGGAKPHPLGPYRHHGRGLPIQQPAALVVVGPADLLAHPDLHRRALAELDAVADGPAGVDVPGTCVGVAQPHPRAFGAGDRARLAVEHPVPGQVLHEHHLVARLVGAEALFLRPAQMQVDEALDLEHRSVQHALFDEALAHHRGDVAALRVGRRHHERACALLRGQGQERARGTRGERLGLDLLEALAEVGERAGGPARERIAHRLAQHRVALADNLVHQRGRHARLLQQPEGRPGAHRLELAVITAEHRAGHPDRARQAREGAKRSGADHRRLVGNQHPAPTERARERAGRERRLAALDAGKAGEEPVDGPRLDPRLLAEHPGGGGRRREPEHRHAPGQAHDLAHQGGFPRARRALHRHRAVGREQDEARRRLLALGEAGRAKARLDRLLARERAAGVARRLHPGDERALGGELARAHEGPPPAVGARLEQVALPAAALERLAERVEPVAARMAHQRGGEHVALAQHARALLEFLHRLAHRLERRRRGRRLDACDPALAPGAGERLAERGRRLDLLAPPRAQRRLAPPRLLPARGQRRGLRHARAVAMTALHHMAQDVAAPGREAREQAPGVAGNLEARRAPGPARLDAVAERAQLAREPAAGHGAEQAGVARERGGLDAAPLPREPRHVHHHHVRMQLRLVVAVGHVHEACGHEPLGAHPRAAAGLAVVAPGLEVARLRDRHRLVHGVPERASDPRIALHAPGHRDGLGHREGQVPAAAVLLRPVAVAPQHEIGARHLAAQHALEGLRAHRPGEPERLGAAPHPRARAPVLGVVARALARAGVLGQRVARVAQIVGEGRAGRAERREGRLHARRARRAPPRPRAPRSV